MREEEIEKYRELIFKFLTGEISDVELANLKSWLLEDAENRQIFNKENELWQGTCTKTKLEYFKTDDGWNNISSGLGIAKNRYNSVVIINKTKFRLLLAAASVAILIAISGVAFWLSESRSARQKVIASTTVSTDEGQKARIYLSNSTLVFMNSGSTLTYDVNYNINKRVVKLTGEAFFNVRTNSEKPFIVQLGRMTVSATGTRFNVFSYGNENRIETTLVEGKISVTVNDRESLEVKSGQQVVYFKEGNKIVIRDVATETYTSWIENRLRLLDTPLEEAFGKIARRYNVTFEIQSHELLDLKYTATFVNESIEEVMQMLQTVSPIKYKIYYRTGVSDKKYLKPKIVVMKRGS